MNIPRINEVTMVWNFQGYQDFRQLTLTSPKVFMGLVTGEQAVRLNKATAVLSGNEGEIFFDFDMSSYNLTTDSYINTDPLANELKRLCAEIFVASSVGRLTGASKEWHISIKFSAKSGESFTTTVGRGFLELFDKLTADTEWVMPVPTVTSRTFFQIGHKRVSFDMALALDLYAENSFQDVIRTYKKEGAKAAVRHYQRVYRSYRGSDYFDRCIPNSEGFEILVGKRDQFSDGTRMGYGSRVSYQYCAALSLDGYDMASCKFGHSDNNDGLVRQAQEFAKTMELYGLTTYKIINGKRSRHTTNRRVSCDYLDRNELKLFQSELAKAGFEEEAKSSEKSLN